MDKKRIFFIILFLAITIGIGFALYYVFFAPKGPATGPDGQTTTSSGQFPNAGDGSPTSPTTPTSPTLPTSPTQPGTGTGQTGSEQTQAPLVTQVVSNPIRSATGDTSGGAKYYNEIDGKFYRLRPDGSVEALSDNTFFNVENVAWSPARDEAIIEYPDGANIYYNFDTESQVTLPTHWEEFSFAKSGNEIAAKSIGFSEENRWLIVSDPQGNSVKAVEPLGNNASRVIVDWSPKGEVLAFSRTGEALGADRQEVLLVGQYGENFKSLIVEGRDLKTQWSPDGTNLLHSVYSARNGYLPELWVVSAAPETVGAGRKLLNVNTWADKCTFADNRYVYCGVPTTIETGSGFVPELADTIPDQIMRIDTQTGLKQPIETDGIHTINDIFIGDDGQTLYFTDKNRSGLFEVGI